MGFEAFGHWGVFNVAVPFFFVCSGYFLGNHIGEEGWWKRECSKRIISIVVPFFIWSVVFAFLPLVAVFSSNLIHGRIASITVGSSLWFWVQILGLSPFTYPGFAQLWYLRTLFLFVLISPLLQYFIHNNVRGRVFLLLVYFAALIVGVGMSSHCRVVKFFYYCFQLEGLFYFCVGLFLRMRERHGETLHGCVCKRFICVSFVIGLLFVMASTFAIRMGVNVYCFARVVFTPLLLIAFWNLVPTCPLPKCITSATFAIYVMHGIVLKMMEMFDSRPIETMVQWGGKYIVAFIVPILVAMFLRRFTPGVSGILFGGR